MQVKIVVGSNYDSEETQELYIDDEFCESVAPLCESPEDAIIGRSLISCEDILKYMQMAHKAGMRGEPLDVIYISEDE